MSRALTFDLFPVVVDPWGPTDERRLNRRARDATRGRQGVYLLRKAGRVRYVGSSVSVKDAAPLRMWKTITRHFQRCAPVAAGHYAFGEDNFCTSSRVGWKLVLLLSPRDASPDDVRATEAAQIALHRPTDQAQKKTPKKPRKKRRR